MKRRTTLIFSALLLLLSAACATKPHFTPENNTAGEVWTVSKAADMLGGSDPIEPFNRSMYAVNDVLMRWLVRPVGYIYGSILPREVVQRIDNVSDNLAFPGRMLSCFLQLKLKGGCTEIGRFLVNSTVGIIGIFDPAAYYLDWNRRHENMGHAFASWGIGPGCVFILPLSTATNPRDQIGALFDSVLDVKFIIPYAQSVASLNRAVNSYESYGSMTESAADRYELYKLALLALRYTEVNDVRYHLLVPENQDKTPAPPAVKAPVEKIAWYYRPQGPLVDSLKSGFFKMQHDNDSWWLKTSLWNTDFSHTGRERKVSAGGNSPERWFQFWINDEKEFRDSPKQLAFIIPGIGTHYTGSTARAFAELLYRRGYSVVVTGNSMNWEFAGIDQGAPFPGYTPDDAQRVREHLKLVLDKLAKDYDYVPARKVVLGYSLGGLQALHIAKSEAAADTLGIDRWLAVNPPVDLKNSMFFFDRCMDVTKEWNGRDFFKYMGDVMQKYMPIASKRKPFMPEPQKTDLVTEKGAKVDRAEHEYDTHLPFSDPQAAAMIGLSFRMTLRELMMDGSRSDKEYSWFSRTGLYKKIDAFSTMDYVRKHILPQHPELTEAQMFDSAGLAAVADVMSAVPASKISILHNLDDPILSESDKLYLDSAASGRLLWFDAGGHLGNLFLEEYHARIFERLDAVGQDGK